MSIASLVCLLCHNESVASRRMEVANSAICNVKFSTTVLLHVFVRLLLRLICSELVVDKT